MTSASGPPSYPPYGPPPYGGPPAPGPSGSSSATVVTALLAVLFVAATALAAWAVHDHGTKSAASAVPVNGQSGLPQPGGSTGGLQGAGGASSTGLPSSASIPTPSLSTSSYVPPSTPTPTHVPLDPETINRTWQVYMNALLNRSLSQLKSATCPKLRHTETGTALDGKYINHYKGHRYRIYDTQDYVTISATVRYVNPNTGGNGGTHVYSWYVTRYSNGHYWVCGIMG